MSYIIINADDFGYSPGVNYGIIDAYKNGVVTSTTLMVNMVGFDHAIELMREHKNLGVGLHLNISLGTPLTSGKTLCDANGKFIKPTQLSKYHSYNKEELWSELVAQYNKFVSCTGHKPTHLDSHLFSSDLIPEMRSLTKRLADQENIPMRNYKTPNFPNVKFINYRDYNAKPNLDYIIDNFEDIIKNEYVELMTHPGYVDFELATYSSYNIQRTHEVKILTSSKLKELIFMNNVKVINYGDIVLM